MSLRLRFAIVLVCTSTLALAGCDGDDPPAGEDAGSMGIDAGPVETDAGPPRDVPCQDESIAMLSFFASPSPATIMDESEDEEAYFRHLVDATGGGLSPSQAYVYARFTESGLEKVEIGDEAALESLDWHIAFRRFVVRLNSGVSGPGYVTVGRTAPDTEFESLDAVPAGLEQRTEAYFTDSCEYVPDGSGLGSPGTAMASFWAYEGCVQMTGNVYVLALPGGRHVKVEVLTYYSEENQTLCNESGGTGTPSGAGQVRLRWAWLD